MNVLIVDDEQHAREAAKLLVPWERLGVQELLEADNGESAKAVILDKQPSIIVTDMHMPVSDGMRLLEWVSEHAPSAKLIVISGFNDFRYVRHTLKHGGIDYLLKPIDPAQLLDAVYRAIEQLNEEEQQRLQQIEQGITLNQYKPVYRDYLFGQLIQPKSDTETVIAQLTEQFPQLASATDCCAILFSLQPVMAPLLKRFGHDRDLAVFAIQNVLNDFVVHEWNDGCAFRATHDPEELVVLLWRGADRAFQRAGQLIQALRDTFGLPFHAGVGHLSPFPASAAMAVESAHNASLHRNLLSVQGPYVWSPGSSDTGAAASQQPAPPDFTTLADPVWLALISRDEQLLATTLRQWFEAVSKLPTITPIHIERWTKQIEIASARWQHRDADAEESSSTPPLSLPFLYEDDTTLSLRKTEENWNALLNAEADRLARLIRQERNVIRDIIEYIERHLQEDLSLQQLAGRFFLSREYVSRRFRQETGVTLSEYVEGLRMEHAKKLLSNRAYKITDIAAMVGYVDEKYFSKVFKKHGGLSPQQFRKLEP
ncbi:helix-turn-helix domain-containing protein [Paenibacillus sp. MMS18-CY102]|uniref:helix-turn-helix domain-containing protein n=1 Tax=Paenibacillus sp. MMS18-CY102 TaxID=2682849 RepID=UPI0013653FD5|nr:helix-turn-helix domain-containing protein [Paenibacillus sp. MMS18-CY102]MWC26859.1 response regulator [Paenibacillus sp. MMS18-CY102]